MAMSSNPGLLKDLCIDFMCDNIEKLYTVKQVREVDRKRYEPEFTFIDSNAYLPMELSEKLLTKLSMQDKLNDEILSVFNCNNVYLRYVILPNCQKLTTKGLRTLKEHKIKKLESRGLNCTVDELISSLGEWTKKNLEALCVSNISSISRPFDISISLSKLRNLRSLDVSNTMFNSGDLNAVVVYLPHLESLDISVTRVDTILKLEKKKKLKKLNLYNLNDATKQLMDCGLLKSMTSLTHLDLSSEENSIFRYRRRWLQFLSDPDCLPNLVSLDVSGSDNVGTSIMEDFLTTHKNLTFLGLMHMEKDAGLPMFTDSTHPLYNPDLKVTGIVTIKQLIASLFRYRKRSNYIFLCLNNLIHFILTPSVDIDIIQLILYVMNCCHYSPTVQMAGFRCLYKIVKDDLVSRIHTSVLSRVMKITLGVMERFPVYECLQIQSLAMLSIDRISEKVKKADTLICLKFALESLKESAPLILKQTSVHVCCNLVAQLSSEEKSQLVTIPGYIGKLLALVSENIRTRIIDSNLRYALLTIFQLSHLCQKTCEVFMDLDGLVVYFKVLEIFINDIPVTESVLGLLNNIALVPSLRKKFLENDLLILTLRRLCPTEENRVRYFAMNIIEHLYKPASEL